MTTESFMKGMNFMNRVHRFAHCYNNFYMYVLNAYLSTFNFCTEFNTHTHTHVRGVGGLFRLNYWNKIMVFDVSYVVVAFIKELIVLYTIDFRFDAHVHASLFSLCNSIRSWTQLNITVEFFVFVPWFWHWWRVFVTIADHEQNTASISQSEFST